MIRSALGERATLILVHAFLHTEKEREESKIRPRVEFVSNRRLIAN